MNAAMYDQGPTCLERVGLVLLLMIIDHDRLLKLRLLLLPWRVRQSSPIFCWLWPMAIHTPTRSS
jgi:hypothetical protein